jgi:hypothetical protein
MLSLTLCSHYASIDAHNASIASHYASIDAHYASIASHYASITVCIAFLIHHDGRYASLWDVKGYTWSKLPIPSKIELANALGQAPLLWNPQLTATRVNNYIAYRKSKRGKLTLQKKEELEDDKEQKKPAKSSSSNKKVGKLKGGGRKNAINLAKDDSGSDDKDLDGSSEEIDDGNGEEENEDGQDDSGSDDVGKGKRKRTGTENDADTKRSPKKAKHDDDEKEYYIFKMGQAVTLIDSTGAAMAYAKVSSRQYLNSAKTMILES